MLLALKVTVVVVNVVIASILVTSLYVVAAGGLVIDLPTGEDIRYRISGQDILFEANVTIKNGGVYDITGVRVAIQVWTEDGLQLVDYGQPAFIIPAGRSHVEEISVPMNISVLEEAHSLIFEDTTLTIAVEAEAFYTAGLVRFHSTYESTKLWRALVTEREILYDHVQVSIEGDDVTLTVPYLVTTSALLSGEANVSVELRNESGPLGVANVTIPLGGRYLGFADLTLTNETYQAMKMRTQLIEFAFVVELSGGARFEDVIALLWSPP